MIGPAKKYQTRDGQEVRIYAVDHVGSWPILGAIVTPNGLETACWRRDGRQCSDAHHPSDLIEVKPRIKRDVWVNVYPPPHSGTFYQTKEIADRFAGSSRIACVKLLIDCEEGEGL